jgi:ATP-dependent protease ClpP protease subunit
MLISARFKKPLDKPDWYKIEAVSEDKADILLYDYIGWPFNEAAVFVRALDSLKQRDIVIRINSPGGDVFDANAIFNAIKAHPSRPTTRIESLAASAASYVGVAGHKREAYKNTNIMIHEPLTVTYGNRFDHQESADVLKQISDEMVDMYADNTNLGKREIRDMLIGEGKKDGTWMNAETAKKNGFIDTIIEAGKPARAAFDLSIFNNLPSELTDGDDEPIVRKYEKALRDVGASKSEAKTILARGLKSAAEEEDAHNEEQREIEALTAEAKRILSVMKSN